MFLNAFQIFLKALAKDVKLTFIAFLLSGIIVLVIYGSSLLDKIDEECKDDRISDRLTITSQAAELKEQREQLFDLFIRQQMQQQSVQHNDSIYRHQAKSAIKKLTP